MTQSTYSSLRSDLIKALRNLEDYGVRQGYTTKDNRALMTRDERREYWRSAYEKGATSGRLSPIETL